MQLTQLLAKPLINLTAATLEGSVCGFWTDAHFKRVRYVQALDEKTYSLMVAYPYGRVMWGEDAALVHTEAQEPQGVRVPFKGKIFDTDGRLTGYLQDVECSPQGVVEGLLTTDGTTLSPALVVSVGDVIVVQGGRKVPKPRKTSAPKDERLIEEAFNLPAESAIKEPSDHAGTTRLPRAPLPKDVNALPQGVNVRLVGDYSFLLGRALGGDLTHQGRTLLTKGSLIDEDAVALARANGLLVTLTALSV